MIQVLIFTPLRSWQNDSENPIYMKEGLAHVPQKLQNLGKDPQVQGLDFN